MDRMYLGLPLRVICLRDKNFRRSTCARGCNDDKFVFGAWKKSDARGVSESVNLNRADNTKLMLPCRGRRVVRVVSNDQFENSHSIRCRESQEQLILHAPSPRHAKGRLVVFAPSG